ncbi:MAG: hypothetical protein V2A79_14135, partial [Planctomycetota bacterium]
MERCALPFSQMVVVERDLPLGLGWLLATLLPPLTLSVLAVAEEVWRTRRRRALLISDPSRLLRPIPSWPGVRLAGGGVGLLLVFLIGYPLLMPFEAWPVGYRAGALLRSAAAVAGAAVLLVQVGQVWSRGLADLALGLLTLAVCTLATAFVPLDSSDRPRHCPVLLNAVVFALGLMTWFWTWLAQVWQQQRDEDRTATENRTATVRERPEEDAAPNRLSPQHSALLPSGVRPGTDPAWTTAGRLVPVNRRFSLVTGVGGLVVAVAMSLWPLLGVPPANDASWGRMSAGIAAHLVLLLALLRCARSAGQISPPTVPARPDQMSTWHPVAFYVLS